MPAELEESNILNPSGTPLKRIMDLQQDYFASGRTKEYGFRKEQLRRLRESLDRFEKAILSALKEDLGKAERESYMMEIALIGKEIRYFQKNLKYFMKPEKRATPLYLLPAKSYRYPEPLGQVLIQSPWNYPFLLNLVPLVGAVAAGNCAVIKPSEVSSHSSQVLAELIHDAFAEEYVSCFLGGAQVSQQLLSYGWNHVFFTGSIQIGRLVASACAKTLTPTTLELGGKSPVIVTQHANIPLAARRIIFGKIPNAGQTCVAPDYILVQEAYRDQLIAALKDEIHSQLGHDIHKNSCYGRIVNTAHFDRLVGLIQEGEVAYGGNHDRQELYIEPTILENVTSDSRLFHDEIFGPLLPLFTYERFDEMVKFIRDKPKPLAAYLFSEDSDEVEKFRDKVAFGGGCINDTIVHLSNNELSFGGIGQSGFGAYHGKYSFDTFSHHKSIVQVSSKFDLPFRYLPESPLKSRVLRFFVR